jgi:hypothetical protein
MRQSQLNKLIDVMVQRRGTLSNSKRKLAALLSNDQVARIEDTVRRHFADHLAQGAA